MKIYEIAEIQANEDGDPINENNVGEVCKALQNRSFPEYKYSDIAKEINIDQHDVMNPSVRKDKQIYRDVSAVKTGVQQIPSLVQADGVTPLAPVKEYVRTEYVNRTPLGFQEMICNKRVSFCLANPVLRLYKGVEDSESEKISTALEKILFDNKIVTQDREVGREIFTWTECAELIFPEDLKNRSDRYGFNTDKKLKTLLYRRQDGYKFWPLKDSTGNMICISIEYKQKVKGKTVIFLDSYTDEEVGKFQRVDGKWILVGITPHEIEKIPVVFGWQPKPEYVVVSMLIKRLEKLLSNHGDVNDYHSAPKLFLENAQNITGFGHKGEAGMVLQGKGEADAKYITWDNAVDSVKLEIEQLITHIYTLTQTPNINFDNIKGLGALTGVAIKLMFMDTHLAVKDKEGVLLDYFQRRNNIFLAWIGFLEPSYKPIIDKIEIESSLDPFMIADDKEVAEIAQIKNGNQATVSQETSVKEAGYDKGEFDRIQKEEKARNLMSISEPTY